MADSLANCRAMGERIGKGETLEQVLGAMVMVTTAVSGIDYVLIYSRRAAVVARERAAAV